MAAFQIQQHYGLISPEKLFPGTRAPGTDAAMSLGTGFDSLQTATKSC